MIGGYCYSKVSRAACCRKTPYASYEIEHQFWTVILNSKFRVRLVTEQGAVWLFCEISKFTGKITFGVCKL
jgi:hypothetical protein